MDEYEVAPPLRDVGKTAALRSQTKRHTKIVARTESQSWTTTTWLRPPFEQNQNAWRKTSIEKSANPQRDPFYSRR